MTKLRLLDLFSGIGGFSLGLERSGYFETVAFCEIEQFPRQVLAKHWPKVPCYDDVRTLSATRLAGDGIAVDALCGGFPCQDISVAGKQAGIGEGTRSGLFFEYVRLVRELRPKIAIVENVSALLDQWLGTVLGSLSEIGYDAEWQVISARDMGLPHLRERVWIVCYPSSEGRQRLEPHNRIFSGTGASLAKHDNASPQQWIEMVEGRNTLRTGDGVSVAVDRRRIGSLGNAVVPKIPEMIGRAIGEQLEAMK